MGTLKKNINMAGISDSTNSSPSSFGLENSLIGEVIGRFEKIRILGSGTFGKAWLVKSLRSQKKYVIKELIERQDGKDKTINEVDILKSCYHFNIIRYGISHERNLCDDRKNFKITPYRISNNGF